MRVKFLSAVFMFEVEGNSYLLNFTDTDERLHGKKALELRISENGRPFECGWLVFSTSVNRTMAKQHLKGILEDVDRVRKGEPI